MNRENFLDSIRRQYADEIHAALLQCEHEKGLDYELLSTLLVELRDVAKHEGLSRRDFEDLVKATLPGTWDNLDLTEAA